MALAVRRGQKGKEETQSGLGDNYIRIQFFLKLKLESTKLRSNSPFLIPSSSAWVWLTIPRWRESQYHPSKKKHRKVVGYSIGTWWAHEPSTLCVLPSEMSGPPSPRSCLRSCLIVGTCLCSCICSWCSLHSRTSFLPTVVMSWWPSFILFFSWVVRFPPNGFAWTLCELRKLALFISVENIFLVCYYLTLWYVLF